MRGKLERGWGGRRKEKGPVLKKSEIPECLYQYVKTMKILNKTFHYTIFIDCRLWDV